jgi:hypothetical protein
VTIDGVWIGNRIYCTLTTRNCSVYTLQLTTTESLWILSTTTESPWTLSVSQLTTNSAESLTKLNCSAGGLLARAQNLISRSGSLNSSQSQSQSESESYVMTDDQPVSKSWFQGPCGSHDRIFISVDIYEFYRCRAPPLTRGRVCHLSWSLAVKC